MSRKFEVLFPDHNWSIKRNVPFLFIKQFVFLLKNLSSAEVVFVMFGGYWSLLPALLGRIFGKPVFIIPGGMDCVYLPSINYGSWRKPLLRLFIKWSYQLCDRLLPVDDSLILSDYVYDPESTCARQGYRHLFPSLKTQSQVIYNGYDTNFWKVCSTGRKRNSFVMVAAIDSDIRFRLKGADVVIKLAQTFPQHAFTIVGMTDHMRNKISDLPENISIHGFLSHEQIREILSEHEFYIQLSLSEGFPNGLCEGMLCGCIPVGSAVGAIPMIIGNTGSVIKKYDFGLMKSEIWRLTNLNDSIRRELSMRARHRIVDNFSIQKREQAFNALIKAYTRRKPYPSIKYTTADAYVMKIGYKR